MQLIKSETYDNLKRAFIAECSARTRYEFVEYGQRNEGYEGLATITDRVAYQEFNHSRMLYTKIMDADDGIIVASESIVTLPYRERWNVEDNLKFIAEDENDEAEFYQKCIDIAKDEGFEEIAELFSMIRQVELQHGELYTHLYSALKNDALYRTSDTHEYICLGCGHIMVGETPPDNCPLCKNPKNTFCIPLPKNYGVC